MGREIWIYQLTNEKAKTGLRKLLNGESGLNNSFQSFLNRRNNAEILNLKHTHLNIISPELLFELTYWLSEEIGLNDEEVNRFLTDEFGISLIFESTTKSEANGFIIFYYTYLDSIHENNKSHKISESGIITDSSKFVDFLDYFILFLHEINLLSGGYINYSKEMKSKIDDLFIKKKKDEDFINQLKMELKKFNSLITPSSGNAVDIVHRTYPELEIFNRSFEYLSKSLYMKRRIKNMREHIIIVDSK